MQTFLPHASFERSASSLDSKRLGKQRIEAWQILSVLLGLRYDDQQRKLVPITSAMPVWAHHPATLQWKGYEASLLRYLEVMMAEWAKRKYGNHKMNVIVKAIYDSPEAVGILMMTQDAVPPWLGQLAYHRSHRSNLIRKNPDYYGKAKWNVPADLPYIWPSQQAKEK